MPIMIKEKTGPQVPVGTHIAICFRIVDLGTQPDSGFGEKEKVVVFWELPHERVIVDGIEKPMGISKFYTKSLGKRANLRKDLVAWRGREFTKEELDGFDLKNILGKACQVSVISNENGKSAIDAVVALPKGMQVPPPQNPLVEWSVQDGKNEVYAKLPEWVRQMADECAEWGKQEAPSEPEPERPKIEDSDVPFLWPFLIPWVIGTTAATSLIC